MFSPGRGLGRPGEVRVTVNCGVSFLISDTTLHKFYLVSKNRRVKHKLHRVYSGSNTGIVLYPSTGETGVLTLRLTRALVLHHTPPTQRIEVIGTTGTVYTLRALLYGYLEHLQWGEVDRVG